MTTINLPVTFALVIFSAVFVGGLCLFVYHTTTDALTEMKWKAVAAQSQERWGRKTMQEVTECGETNLSN